MRDLLSAGIFWTPGTAVETHASGLDPFCRLTTAQGAAIASAAGRSRRGWAWMAPRESSLTIAEALSGRFVADMEVPSPRTPTAQLGAFWRGQAGEVSFARDIARHATGVTSHGLVKDIMRGSLTAFAEAGLPVFCQTYDTDRSTLRNPGGPAQYLRDCVSMHTDLGFRAVVPILGLKAGPDIVRVWLDTCAEMGLAWHLWRIGNWSADFAFVRSYLPENVKARAVHKLTPPTVEGRPYTGPEAMPDPSAETVG